MKKRLIPGYAELLLLAAMAILSAAILTWWPIENGMAIAAFPLVLGAMLMGARRAGRLAAAPQPAERTENHRSIT